MVCLGHGLVGASDYSQARDETQKQQWLVHLDRSTRPTLNSLSEQASGVARASEKNGVGNRSTYEEETVVPTSKRSECLRVARISLASAAARSPSKNVFVGLEIG